MNPITQSHLVAAPGIRRCAWFVALAILAGLLLQAGGPSASAASKPQIEPVTPLVTMQWRKGVYAKPAFPGKAIMNLFDQRPLTLTHTTMPVIAAMTDEGGRQWLQVRLPGREMRRKSPPASGWMTSDGMKASITPWHLVISIATRSVHVYKDGRRLKTFKVVVGKPSTPTPKGEFFVEETMRLPRKHVGYPFALATSARSHVFREFMGGPGQIALHGMVNIPGSKMGTAASNGCIRMRTPALMWMAKHIKAGTPLTVH